MEYVLISKHTLFLCASEDPLFCIHHFNGFRFYGYKTSGGALEVGQASTKAVVFSSVWSSFQSHSDTTSLNMIEAKEVDKFFGDHHVLINISCSFEKGKTNLIIGQSGSGKTVLMNALSDCMKSTREDHLWRPELFRDEFWTAQKPPPEIGMLFQEAPCSIIWQ